MSGLERLPSPKGGSLTSSSRQPGPRLSFRQRLTWAAHFFKALAYQYHRDFGERVAGLIPSDAVIVDVGAHSGQFAKLFARLAPKGRVYAFEPGAYALSILRPVLRLRGFRNVVVVPLGLSDRPGSETLSLPLKKRGSVGFGLAHIGAEISGRTTIVQQIALTTLDAFAAEQGLARLDFIKVDIEGWEPHFLRGAAATLARFRPVVMIEVAQPALERAGAAPEEIFAALAPLDYRIFKTREHDAYRMQPVSGFEGSADYLFVPVEMAGRVAEG